MVFSSIPPYLDPSNWHQQPPPPNHHLLNQPGSGTNHPHNLQTPTPPPPPPPPPPSQTHGGSSIRPGSMADRARQANIPMPEAPLKCPRCDSANTKFCYFNNYSLSQPRHFCKTCRRYWTRGGALRSVPVGGGCRRNKRSKGSSSKSPATSSERSASGGAAINGVSSGVTSGGLGHGSEILGLGGVHLPSLRLMPPLQYLNDFSSGEMGMNLYSTGMMPPSLGGGSSNFSASATTSVGGGGVGSPLLGVGMERLRLAQASQFPFLSGSDPYPFEGSFEPSEFISPMRPKPPSPSPQVAPVKMEDNNNNPNHNNQDHLNFSRQFLGMMNPVGNDHPFQWNTATAWTDLSGFSSSSTSNNPP